VAGAGPASSRERGQRAGRQHAVPERDLRSPAGTGYGEPRRADAGPWYLAYPGGFAQLRDISLGQTPGAAGRLFGSTVPLPVLERREQSVRRIWVVPMRGSGNPVAYLAPGFRLAHEWKVGGYQVVLLYTNPG
jgi:hypothetical protein